MKIAYIGEPDFEKNSGVLSKMRNQTQEWVRQAGHEVSLISMKNLVIEKEGILDRTYDLGKNPSSVIEKAMGYHQKCRKLDILLDELDPDLIYTRYGFYSPYLESAFKKRKTIMEINSFDLEELKTNGNWIAYTYHAATRNRILKQIAGFVGVTHELEDRYKHFGVPTICIANACAMNPSLPKSASTDRPRIGFIGSPGQKWHGMDKIALMARNYPEWEFEIIGPEITGASNIRNHGYLQHQAAEDILETCHVGISTLSLHEKMMNEACPLKTRHYLSLGLPIIYGYTDPDLEPGLPFALQLPNTPDNVGRYFAEIRKFVENVFKQPEFRLHAQKYAKEHLSFATKELERLRFFSTL